MFRVRHDASAPFVVQTGRTSARVLGTSFLVRQYDTDSAATVAVRDGRVGVRSLMRSPMRSVVLSANQQVAVGERGVGPVQSASASAFTFATGVLTFDGVTLAQAIPDLDRWYDVDLRLGDPALARLTPAGGFTAGSPADLSALLTMMFPVRVERHGRVLTLYSK
jgi:transmembrane sensor